MLKSRINLRDTLKFLFFIKNIVIVFSTVFFLKDINLIFVYILFYTVFTLYLYYSFFEFYSFTHLILSCFLWLGFAFKYSVNKILDNTNIVIHSSFLRLSSYDEITLHFISIVGISGMIISFFFSKLLNNKKNIQKEKISIAEKFFDYRTACLLIFLICIISFINTHFNFYQRGIYNESEFAIFFSFFFQVYLPAIIYFFFYRYSLSGQVLSGYIFLNLCILIYSISILSRAYVIINLFNILVFLLIFILPKKVKFNFKIISIILFFTLTFSIINIFSVSELRKSIAIENSIEKKITRYQEINQEYNEAKKEKIKENLIQNKINEFKLQIKSTYSNERPKLLYIIEIISNRFVGIEELALVYQFKERNFKLFKRSFYTKSNRASFFDQLLYDNQLGNSYLTDNKINKKLVSINTPGIFAFLYLSNSLILIFVVSFLISLLINLLEDKIKIFFMNPFFIFSIFYFLINKIIHFGHNPLEIYKSFIGILSLLVLFYVKKIILKYFCTRFLN